MITLRIAPGQHWDSENGVFVNTPETVVHLEHSLRAVSKWESKHSKPFLGRREWTAGQTLDYIRCMCRDEGVDPAVFLSLSKTQIEAVRKYIDLPMTATKISKRQTRGSRGSFVTSEVIYFWMSSYGIDWQAQDWHLNRLLTLIQVASEKSRPPKRMPKQQAAARQHALNAARRQKYHTGG